MKKLLVLLFIVFTCQQYGYCQSLHIDSTRFITGNKVGTSIRFAIPTADKGILFVGSEFGNPGGIIPYFPIDTGVNGNVLIGKIDSNRHISWVKVYGGSSADAGTCVCQIQGGGYAVLAGTASNNGDVTGYRGGGGDFWLIRIDGSGNLLWEKTYGSSAQDVPMSIACTPENGFILFGTTNGSDGDVPFHYGDFFSMDWLVIKTDSMGNLQWSKDLGGSGTEGNGSILVVDSNYFLVSNSFSTDIDCTDTIWHSGVNTGSDYYVLKLDQSGNVLWDSSYGGTGGEGVYNAMFDNRDSSILITGVTRSNDYMVTGYHGCDDGDLWIVKINVNGKLLWQKALGSVQEEYGSSICSAANGGYLAYGSTKPYFCHDTTIGDIGYYDCWLFMLDSEGNINSEKIFGGVNIDDPASIVPYLNGYVATGFSSSHVFFEGSTYGNFDSVGGAFITYINYLPLGVDEVNKKDESTIKVFPNPLQINLNLILSSKTGGRVSIINSIGQETYKREIQALTLSWVRHRYSHRH